ncbi:MAG: tRNA pseudouridine(55) synthase TruB [Gammaproteobacteria bacterium]
MSKKGSYQNINGLLLLDKPAGISSNQALQKVKKIFNAKKAGHTGSLDPIATGMLPICFGETTKVAHFLLNNDKGYLVTAKFGVSTTTGDREGEILETKSTSKLSKEIIISALKSFEGQYDQKAPLYSALKYEGKPLYYYARKGIEVPRKTRTIEIYSIKFESFESDILKFHVMCSKGTYIRSLVEDVAKKIDSVAHIQELRRTHFAWFKEADMFSLENVENDNNKTLDDKLLPSDEVLKEYDSVYLDKDSANDIKYGRRVSFDSFPSTKIVRIYDEKDELLAIGEVVEKENYLQPKRVFIKD